MDEFILKDSDVLDIPFFTLLELSDFQLQKILKFTNDEDSLFNDTILNQYQSCIFQYFGPYKNILDGFSGSQQEVIDMTRNLHKRLTLVEKEKFDQEFYYEHVYEKLKSFERYNFQFIKQLLFFYFVEEEDRVSFKSTKKTISINRERHGYIKGIKFDENLHISLKIQEDRHKITTVEYKLYNPDNLFCFNLSQMQNIYQRYYSSRLQLKDFSKYIKNIQYETDFCQNISKIVFDYCSISPLIFKILFYDNSN